MDNINKARSQQEFPSEVLPMANSKSPSGKSSHEGADAILKGVNYPAGMKRKSGSPGSVGQDTLVSTYGPPKKRHKHNGTPSSVAARSKPSRSLGRRTPPSPTELILIADSPDSGISVSPPDSPPSPQRSENPQQPISEARSQKVSRLSPDMGTSYVYNPRVHLHAAQPSPVPETDHAPTAWKDQNQYARSRHPALAPSYSSPHEPCPSYMDTPPQAAFIPSHCDWQTVSGTQSRLSLQPALAPSYSSPCQPCPSYMDTPPQAAFISSHCDWQTVSGTQSGLLMTGPRSMDDEGEPRNYQTMHSGAEALDLSTGNGRRVGNRLSKHDRHGNQVHELGGQLANQQSPVSEVRADNSQVPVSATISGLCSEGPDAMTDNRDLPTGQRDSPIGQRDSSVGQRDDSWDQARQSCWDVVQSNVPTSTNIRAARNNFILSPQNDGSQQSDMIVTSPSLASSIPFSPVPSTAAVINAGASSALQSSSPFSDMDLLSNGAEGLAQPAGQMTNPSANMFPSPDPRFTLSSMMNSSVLSPSLVSLSYPGSLYDPSAGQSALSSSPLLGFPSYSTTRKRRIDQREKKDQEPSTSKTTASSSSATLTSAEASSDGEDPDAKKAKAVPEEKKDEAYWERRRKNNEAAKRSRDARRQKEEEIAMRATFLEQENLKLRAQVAILKNETAKLHYLLYNRRQ